MDQGTNHPPASRWCLPPLCVAGPVQARIKYDPSAGTGPRTLIEVVEDAGFEAKLWRGNIEGVTFGVAVAAVMAWKLAARQLVRHLPCCTALSLPSQYSFTSGAFATPVCVALPAACSRHQRPPPHRGSSVGPPHAASPGPHPPRIPVVHAAHAAGALMVSEYVRMQEKSGYNHQCFRSHWHRYSASAAAPANRAQRSPDHIGPATALHGRQICVCHMSPVPPEPLLGGGD
jgi:hypothetical protein